MTADPVTFMVAGGPSAAVAEAADGSGVRLAAGEAESITPTDSFQVRSEADDASTLLVLALTPGAGAGGFTPGAGRRDVDLVRDVLATNEALVVEAGVSAFVAVTAGAVDAGGTIISSATPVPMTGRLVLINTSPETATVLVAVVGPVVQGTAEPGGTPGTSGTGTSAPPVAPGSSTVTTATATTEPAATTTEPPTTTTTTPDVDTDNDGLTDSVEAQLGTDPNNGDSDGDGIPDGREVNALGSNPLDTDSDSDVLTDAREVDHSCDINRPDTDGDGLGDAFEANSGFSECSLADTDGDGDDDLAEFSLGTHPRDPDCFSGPGSVCTA